MANRTSLPKSTMSGSVGATPTGNFLAQQQNRMPWERGYILDYSPQDQTYSVNTDLNALIASVPRLVNDPGEVCVLPRGTQVLVHRELGFPIIAGVLKGAPLRREEVSPTRVTEVRGVGGEDPVYSSDPSQQSSRPANDPVDVLGGDWIRKSAHNNFVGVLAGGSNVMHSAPMAQIRTHSVPQSMVEVIANVYRHISSLGNLEIKNDGGRTSLVWRAGASQTTESGSNLSNWTIHLDAGSTGDLFRLKVTTPNQNTLCEMHMSADGRLSLTGVAGVDVTSGPRGNYLEEISADKDVRVGGSVTTDIAGQSVEQVGDFKSVSVGSNHTVSAGANLEELVGNDRRSIVSNTMRTTVSGGTVPTPGTVAILWEATGGGITTVTGTPAIPTGFDHTTINNSGNVNVAVPVTGKFNVISSAPDSVVLGGNGAAVPIPGTNGAYTVTSVALEHAAKYEPLQAIISQMLLWMDTHTHLTAVGPTSPGAAGTSGPISPTINANLPLVKSIKVAIGG